MSSRRRLKRVADAAIDLVSDDDEVYIENECCLYDTPFGATRLPSYVESQGTSRARALARELDEEADAIRQVNEAEMVGTDAIINRLLLYRAFLS